MCLLDNDIELLCDDYDRLVALESLGVKPDYPAVKSIVRRWELDRAIGHEDARSVVHGAIDTTKDAVKKLAVRFKDWAAEYGKEYQAKLADAISKATTLERQCEKLQSRVALLKEVPEHPVYTGLWTSCICYEDKPNFEECIRLAENADKSDAMIKKYTVLTRSVLGKSRKVEDSSLERLGRSTNWAIKRSAGILGIVNPFNEIEAYPLAGNVIIVTYLTPGRAEKYRYAVARNGDYGETIEQLNIEQCRTALKSAYQIASTLRDRGTKRRVFGYHGIYDEIEKMKGELEGLEGKELKEATLRFKNALQLEDAFTTALARTGDGLVTWVKSSIAKKV